MKHQNLHPTETIIACATPPGSGGVAVIRLSGGGVRRLAIRLHSQGQVALERPRELIFGTILAGKKPIDQGLIVFMPAPHSYTGEDIIELQTHGSPAVVAATIAAGQAAGAHLAEPGEFTKRAYLNGQLDLAQAEAVAEVIAADTQAALALSQSQLAGALSRQIEELRGDVVAIVAELSAWLDFSEEDLADIDRFELTARIENIAQTIDRLVGHAKQGAVVRDGLLVALIGLPNAGKSSLLNALSGYSRAIVTEIPGTTRDTLAERIEVNGLGVRLIDTAGVSATKDRVEELGVRRALDAAQTAGLILLCASSDQDISRFGPALAKVTAPMLGVQTKVDIAKGKIEWPVTPLSIIKTSAKKGSGLNELRQAIYEMALGGNSELPLTASQRHIEAMAKAYEYLTETLEALDQDAPLDVIAGHLTLAAESLATIAGVNVSREVIDSIFSRFCIGK